MTKEPKKSFYKEQFPELVAQMTRIADALERQVELAEERQKLDQEAAQKEQLELDGQRAVRRKKFEAQLQKLAEVDRMARELRTKLEEKQAAEAAAKAAAGTAEAAGEADPDGQGEDAESGSPPPEN